MTWKYGYIVIICMMASKMSFGQTEYKPASVQESEHDTESSVEVRELDGIVVDGQRIRMEDNMIIGVPTKAEKNLSNTPASLLESMQFPGLKVDGETISTFGGQTVDVFINGVPVTDVDYKTFRPKHTVRVEYMVHPSDPVFLGSAYAVNFIVQEPVVGGVTKLDLSQHFPNFGSYDVGTKLNHDRMSYGVLFDTYYDRNHSKRETGTETFSDVMYGGTEYQQIERTYSQTGVERTNHYNLSVNNRYVSPRFRMVHTVALGWWRNPGSGSDDSQVWDPELFTAHASVSRNSGSTFSPQVTGSYWMALGHRWKALNLTWRYTHTRNDGESSYEQTGMAPVENSTRENSDILRVILATMYTVKEKFYLILKGNGEFSWFDTRYAGSADVRQRQHRQSLTATASMTYYFSPSLVASITPGIDFNAWQVGDISEGYVKPTAEAGVWWTCSSKCQLGMNVNCIVSPVGASRTNPVTTQVSDLEWQRGNPYLREGRIWSFTANGVYSPCNAVDLSGGVMYERNENQVIMNHTPNPDLAGGLLRDFINAEPFSNTVVNAGVSGRLLDGRFTYSVSADYVYSHSADRHVAFRSGSFVTARAEDVS